MEDILIVEDHGILREELLHFLRLNAYRAEGVNCGLAVDDWLMEHGGPPDIAVLDLNLPGEDGLRIAARLRRTYPRIGIVMLTGRKQSTDRIIGYEAGADVYLTKPVSGEELIAVLRSLQRRLAPAARPAWHLAPLTGVLTSPAGASAPLSLLECAVIRTMATGPDSTASSEQLLQVCGDQTIEHEKNYLEVVISRLRRKLAPLHPDPAAPLIRALRGRGYQLLISLEID